MSLFHTYSHKSSVCSRTSSKCTCVFCFCYPNVRCRDIWLCLFGDDKVLLTSSDHFSLFLICIFWQSFSHLFCRCLSFAEFYGRSGIVSTSKKITYKIIFLVSYLDFCFNTRCICNFFLYIPSRGKLKIKIYYVHPIPW